MMRSWLLTGKKNMVNRILIDTNVLLDSLVQMECARAYNAEYIVTRNIDDYRSSDIKAILPEDYLKL